MAGDGPAVGSQRVLVGRIGAAHGIRGEVRIQSFCADPLDIAAYGPLYTDRSDSVIRLASARRQKDMVIARIEGVTDRTAAERLNGTGLFVPRDRLPATDGDDDFYIADLIGLEARLPEGQRLGSIASIENYGAGDIIEIALDTGGTALFAFTRQTVPHVRLEDGYLVIVPPQETEIPDAPEQEP